MSSVSVVEEAGSKQTLDGAVRWAASVLDALAGTVLPVPRCVASDDSVPASLTTWLPGTVDLNPDDPQRWLTDLADTLVQIHQVPPPPTLPLSDAAADPNRSRPQVV